jgi:hypothetical protein
MINAYELSFLSPFIVPEDGSPLESGEAAACCGSFFREVGIPETSWRRESKWFMLASYEAYGSQQAATEKQEKYCIEEKKRIMAGNHIQFFSKIHIKRTNCLRGIELLHQLKGEIGYLEQWNNLCNLQTN